MKTKWRLLDTGPLPAAYNMALEWVLLTSCNRGWAPNTIHLLEFTRCALLGYHQAVELEVEEEYCREHGIEINRRISGGGCIYMHEDQLGWEIIARKDTPGIPPRSEDMYRLFCKCAIDGLAKLDIVADYRPLNDIEVGGRKISGTGGMDYDDSFIFHGTVLADFDVDTMIKCLKLPIKKLEDKQITSFKQRVTSIKEILGLVPPMGRIKAAMAEVLSPTGTITEPRG